MPQARKRKKKTEIREIVHILWITIIHVNLVNIYLDS